MVRIHATCLMVDEFIAMEPTTRKHAAKRNKFLPEPLTELKWIDYYNAVGTRNLIAGWNFLDERS